MSTLAADQGPSSTRDRIIEIAREMFSEGSFGGVSLGQIARRAGVSPPLIIKLFQSKENLFAATLDFRESAKRLFDAPFEHLAEAAITETLSAPFQASYSMIRTISIAGGSDETLGAIGERIKSDILAVLQARIENEAPHPHPAPRLRAQSATALIAGLSLMRRIGDTDFYDIDPDQLRAHYTEVMQEILNGQPAPAGK